MQKTASPATRHATADARFLTVRRILHKKRTNGALSNGASHDIDIVRGRNQIENVAREIEQGDRLGTQAKAAIGALVRWLLGEDKALGELGL